MSRERQQLGSWGESLAAAVLRQNGYRLLARNVRTPVGEIDLIARHGEDLVFIEVKLRRSLHWGSPAEGVTSSKQRRLKRAAQYYLRKQPQAAVQVRFDVVAITLLAEQPEVEIIQAAF
ncbi:MAG: YraN family protein [Desulfobacca sp.]|uniref:YraN family protein n=1 Tax=Desulfobacca sp. TaxID=2067990 RepID=UPI00404906D7